MKIKKFKIILSLFLIIGIAAGGVLGYYDARLEAAVNNKNGSTLTDVKVDDNLTFNKNVINILLVGSDHGAIKGDHGRSDSIMIATVNFKTKELKLTSLMRDMYVEIPGHGHNKLNAAYAFGGVELLYQTIAKNFGIKIDNYCVVDFSTFEKVINKVGGVEISLEEKEAKYLNTTNYISKKKYRNVKVGKQTLNGNQALGYARVRYVVSKKYGDGDFGRTGRQRAVLQAALNKVLQQSPTKIADIALDSLADVSTDMSAKCLKSLVLKVIQMTFGYSGTSSSDSTSSSSSYSTSSTRSSYQQESYSTTSSSHTTYSTRSTTTRSTEERVTESTTSQPQTSAPRPTTAHHTTTAAATESTPSGDSVEEE